MPVTNTRSGTRIDEIADGIFRINTPISIPGGPGFSFNQYLILDAEPLIFHTGLRKLFPVIREAVASVIPVESLRYISFSHVEADECGALNEWLAVAPRAIPLCSRIAAMTSINDLADRAPRALQENEVVSLGQRSVRWLDTPHLPHGWESGLLFEERTKTLFCGDLFTQSGTQNPPLTQSDILGPSEAFRKAMDYFAHAPDTRAQLAKLAGTKPATLACMHGSAWQGEGATLLRALAEALPA